MQEENLSFYHLGIAPKMLQVLEKLNFESPTPVQHSAIPIAIEGKDVVAVAQTGTGKTLAFGIPMIQRLSEKNDQALVLAPTRDLALQVSEVIKTIIQPFKIKQVALVGGMPMARQIQKLKRKPQIIIATPGRLMDHVQRKTLKLSHVKYLVLDEADRMLDMGFAPQVTQIMKSASEDKQTLLFSATLPKDIVQLATKHMKIPIHVEIAPSGNISSNVTQELFIIKEDNKKALLLSLLEQYRGSVLLFTRTKVKTKRMSKDLKQKGYKSIEIHSDRSMAQRKQAIEGFKSGRYRILVATDVAARGIDVKNIELVINYDLPDDIENYVHRIGRSGRAGQKGHAITFAAPNQGRDVQSIEKLIKSSIPKGVREGFGEEAFEIKRKKQSGKKRSRRRRSFDKGSSPTDQKRNFRAKNKKPRKPKVKGSFFKSRKNKSKPSSSRKNKTKKRSS